MAGLKIALIGNGTVGNAVYRTVHTHQDKLEAIFGKKVEVAGILVQHPEKHRNTAKEVMVTDNIEEILAIPDLDIAIESIVGVEPGYQYLLQLMEKGCHVITANKELVASKGSELKSQANRCNVRLEYEAAVAGGVPVIGTLKQLLHVNRVVRIEAILNGTSNFMLTEMTEKNISFETALAMAQENGFAEADPSNDIDGWDAFYKLMVLSELLFQQQPDWEKIERRGIRGISQADIAFASRHQLKIKHVATIENLQGKVTASVEPVIIGADHPLYSVDGVDNAICIEGDLVGKLKLQGPGAGALPTASAIVEDLANLVVKQPESDPVQSITFLAEADQSELDWILLNEAAEPKIFQATRQTIKERAGAYRFLGDTYRKAFVEQ